MPAKHVLTQECLTQGLCNSLFKQLLLSQSPLQRHWFPSNHYGIFHVMLVPSLRYIHISQQLSNSKHKRWHIWMDFCGPPNNSSTNGLWKIYNYLRCNWFMEWNLDFSISTSSPKHPNQVCSEYYRSRTAIQWTTAQVGTTNSKPIKGTNITWVREGLLKLLTSFKCKLILCQTV